MSNKGMNFYQKRIEKRLFEEAVQGVVDGRFTIDQAAAHCHVSRYIFERYGNKYLFPDEYGALPDGVIVDIIRTTDELPDLRNYGKRPL